jgi:WD40 repeat protein
VEIWDVGAARLLHTLLGQAADVASLVFGPDGRRLETAGADFTVHLGDTSSGWWTLLSGVIPPA